MTLYKYDRLSVFCLSDIFVNVKMNTKKRILLTGPPGIGKTTLVQKICKKLNDSGVPIRGFYTEEVRTGRNRIGFDVVTLDGKRGTLARLQEHSPKTVSSCMVGRYVVTVQSFEALALPVFQKQENEVLVLDEIGRMELFSESFKREVTKAFDNAATILATIPVPKGKPMVFIDNLRQRPNTTIIMVDRNNRDELVDKILPMLSPEV